MREILTASSQHRASSRATLFFRLSLAKLQLLALSYLQMNLPHRVNLLTVCFPDP